MYIIDRVQVFQQNDTFSFSFGGKGSKPGQFQCPIRIAIDPNNNVLVTDLTKSIYLFTYNGQFKQIQSRHCVNFNITIIVIKTSRFSIISFL